MGARAIGLLVALGLAVGLTACGKPFAPMRHADNQPAEAHPASASPDPIEPASWEDTVPALQATIMTEKTTYKVGEPVLVLFSLTNTGRAAATVPENVPGGRRGEYFISLQVTDASGNAFEGNCLYRFAYRISGPTQAFILPPGQGKAWGVMLTLDGGPPPKGKYRVSGSYNDSVKSDILTITVTD